MSLDALYSLYMEYVKNLVWIDPQKSIQEDPTVSTQIALYKQVLEALHTLL